eukprot:4542460-Amphidinium_carterae.1
MQLRLQQGIVTGRQAPGLPNQWGMRMLEQAAQLQQHEPLIRDVHCILRVTVRVKILQFSVDSVLVTCSKKQAK